MVIEATDAMVVTKDNDEPRDGYLRWLNNPESCTYDDWDTVIVIGIFSS